MDSNHLVAKIVQFIEPAQLLQSVGGFIQVVADRFRIAGRIERQPAKSVVGRLEIPSAEFF